MELDPEARRVYDEPFYFQREVSLPMKVRLLTGVAALAAIVSFAVISAQAPSAQQSGVQASQTQKNGTQPTSSQHDTAPYGGHEKVWDGPIHTTVLPKDATVQQLSDIMIEWRLAIADQGRCVTCHAWSKDPKNVNSFGFPDIDAYDDSKPEYKASSEMYVMMAGMNKKYASTKGKITCGSCHRGHLIPEAYVAPALPGGPPPGQPVTPPKGQNPPSQGKGSGQ